MAERVVVVAVDGSDQADKAFNCKSFCILYIYVGFYPPIYFEQQHGWNVSVSEMALDTRRVVYRSGFPINTPRLNGFVLSKEKKLL